MWSWLSSHGTELLAHLQDNSSLPNSLCMSLFHLQKAPPRREIQRIGGVFETCNSMPQWHLRNMVENGASLLLQPAENMQNFIFSCTNHKLAWHLQASLEFAPVSKVDLSDGHLEQTASAISACQSREGKQDLEKIYVYIIWWSLESRDQPTPKHR